MDSDAIAPMVVMLVLSVSIAVVFILRGPVGKALGRKIEGSGAGDPELEKRVDDLETRLLAAEQVENRLAEVEERLDFAERMLAREKKHPQIQGNG